MSQPFTAGVQPQDQYGQQSGYGQPRYPQPPGYSQGIPFQPAPSGLQGPGGMGLQGAASPAAQANQFITGLTASNILLQSGENYMQKGQAFMSASMGFLNQPVLHYHFNINTQYVRSKLLMLLAPYLRRWNYTRILEQIAGGHKYLPPRQDVNAPDLYIPFMAMCTYCLLISVSYTSKGKFTPDNMYSTVSLAAGAWSAHAAALKVMLYALGIPSAVPFLELVSYGGYPFVPVCLTLALTTLFGQFPVKFAGGYAAYIAWFYGSLCMAIFMVRTMKRIIFHEARQLNINNYLLLGLALFQFPYALWLGLWR